MDLRIISFCYLVSFTAVLHHSPLKGSETNHEKSQNPMRAQINKITAEGGDPISLLLPQGKHPDAMVGIEITLVFEEIRKFEPFSLVFNGESKTPTQIPDPLCIVTFLQPLKISSKEKIYILPPKLSAWKKVGQRWQLILHPTILAAHPKRPIPKMTILVESCEAKFSP